MPISKTKLTIVILGAILLTFPLASNAQTLGQQINFFVDSSYDLYGRKEISATLIKITDQLYFYIDADWWDKLNSSEKRDIDRNLDDLGDEFERKIYPNLTSTFGSEAKPGIDRDKRITILIQPIIREAGGYFNSGDSYFRLQNPRSNEREMVYLNAKHIDIPLAKVFLAHEFTHLITANQKDLLRNVTEEVWLNEARAEYAPTLLGYDDTYKGSNLERRVKAFLEEPNDSLTEWLNREEDYGAINLFTQYLVDHYGVKILKDSLQSSKIGISSINYALEKNGFKDNFSQIFANWAIAVLANDCKLGSKYCYLNKNLKDLRIVPNLYYLSRAETVLSNLCEATYWAANWQRFIGGGQNLTSEFEGVGSVEFEIPYLLCDLKGECFVEFLVLDGEQKGKIIIPEFNAKYSSLTFIPFIKSKTSGFDGRENYFSFSWKVTVQEKSGTEREAELISQLQLQIKELQKEIKKLQSQINAILGKEQTQVSCLEFESNLYYGMRDNSEVRCLQEFLKNQGPEIYSEGLVTGNFLILTQSAVIRFQEKYNSEILKPLGLERGTGYVGPATRTKINQLLGY